DNVYAIDIIALDESENTATFEIVIVVLDESETVLSTSSSGLNQLIYPNPAVNYLLIKNDITAIERLAISNLEGKIEIDLHVYQNEIDISGLPSGVYILLIETKTDSSQIRFIKK
ncbi:MAG: T9SS type A sorting domain-containing protein, partial [Cyclobacteriaceae bacterium]